MKIVIFSQSRPPRENSKNDRKNVRTILIFAVEHRHFSQDRLHAKFETRSKNVGANPFVFFKNHFFLKIAPRAKIRKLSKNMSEQTQCSVSKISFFSQDRPTREN